MSNAQCVIDVAQLSHCVVHHAPASTPDQLCLCSVSIFALGELPTASHTCLRRSAGMHSCILTTNNSNKLNSIICPYFESFLLQYCVYIWGAQLYKSSQINRLLNMTRRHTQCVLIPYLTIQWLRGRAGLRASCVVLVPAEVWKRSFLLDNKVVWIHENMKRADVCIFSDKIHFVILVK